MLVSETRTSSPRETRLTIRGPYRIYPKEKLMESLSSHGTHDKILRRVTHAAGIIIVIVSVSYDCREESDSLMSPQNKHNLSKKYNIMIFAACLLTKCIAKKWRLAG